MKLLNAFSINMLTETDSIVRFTQIYKEEAKDLFEEGLESCIGHQDMANLLSKELGLEVVMNRCTATLESGEHAIVAQYSGPRLPEGCTKLPEGATIKWYLINVTARF